MPLTMERLAALALLIGATALRAEPAQPGDANWSLLSRNFFLHNDFRSPSPSDQSYQQEWAQGFIAEVRSGFTPGTLGLGVDTHGFLFDSRAIAILHVQAGRFTRFKNQDSSSGHGDFDGYGASTRGSAIGFAGAIDTLAYSLLAKYRIVSQAFTLAYQHVHGDTPFDFVGGTYNPVDPASGTAVPLQGKDGRHWERDIDLRYVFPSGPAKDLSLYLSHVSHRANEAQAGADIDRLYLIFEYPLKGWF